jgi:hypothetical protein
MAQDLVSFNYLLNKPDHPGAIGECAAQSHVKYQGRPRARLKTCLPFLKSRQFCVLPAMIRSPSRSHNHEHISPSPRTPTSHFSISPFPLYSRVGTAALRQAPPFPSRGYAAPGRSMKLLRCSSTCSLDHNTTFLARNVEAPRDTVGCTSVSPPLRDHFAYTTWSFYPVQRLHAVDDIDPLGNAYLAVGETRARRQRVRGPRSVPETRVWRGVRGICSFLRSLKYGYAYAQQLFMPRGEPPPC